MAPISRQAAFPAPASGAGFYYLTGAAAVAIALLLKPALDLVSARPAPVERRALGAQRLESALAELALGAVPRVLTGAALPSLSRADIAQAQLSRVYTGPSPRFGPYFDDKRPMSALKTVRRRAEYSEASMSGVEFWSARPHVYYSGELERDLDSAILARLRPLERSLASLRPERSSVNLWLGRAGGVAPCHYDGYHNAVAMLHGRKRFLLLPPAASALLQPFPFLHPSHAQCQIEPRRALGRRALAEAGAHEVVLEAGEVLYLPPLWYHEVEALGDAVSVNSWAEPEEAETAAALFELRRPSARPYAWPYQVSAPSAAGAAAGAARLVARLLATVEGEAGAEAAAGPGAEGGALAAGVRLGVRRLWRERYAPLLASGELDGEWRGEGAAAALRRPRGRRRGRRVRRRVGGGCGGGARGVGGGGGAARALAAAGDEARVAGQLRRAAGGGGGRRGGRAKLVARLGELLADDCGARRARCEAKTRQESEGEEETVIFEGSARP